MDLSDRLAAALRLSLPEKPDPAAALKNKVRPSTTCR